MIGADKKHHILEVSVAALPAFALAFVEASLVGALRLFWQLPLRRSDL